MMKQNENITVIIPYFLPTKEYNKNVLFAKHIDSGVIVKINTLAPLAKDYIPLHLYLLTDHIIQKGNYYMNIITGEIKYSNHTWEQVYSIAEFGNIQFTTDSKLYPFVQKLDKGQIDTFQTEVLSTYYTKDQHQELLDLHKEKLIEIVTLNNEKNEQH